MLRRFEKANDVYRKCYRKHSKIVRSTGDSCEIFPLWTPIKFAN